MKYKIQYVMFISTLLLVSCSTRLYKINSNYVINIEEQKTFNIEDFNVYVYNICEKYTKKIDPIKRFCNCPENFFDVAKSDSLKKIEEVYFLTHKQSNLVIYLTTQSHQFISNKQKGFLNDRELYENKINLNEIEYAYVGQINRSKNNIRFKHKGKDKDIVLSYNPTEFPMTLTIDKANIATVENNYSISQPIDMNTIFTNQLSYKKSACDIFYYDKKQPLKVEKISVVQKKNNLNLFFHFNTSNDKLYKIGSGRLRYQLEYSQIDPSK